MFELRVPGKWVLAGEHAVLRGAGAVALPHPEFALSLRYEENQSTRGEGLAVNPVEAAPVTRELIRDLLGTRSTEFSGKLDIQSTIPVGSGLGSSAALCVGLVKWSLWILKERKSAEWILAKATELENRFHGKSSGMDIAAVSSEGAIRFTCARGPEVLRIKNPVRFTFHDTGHRARTLDCIARVEKLFEQDRGLAERLDAQMALASDMAARSLEEGQHDGLARSMEMAHQCFEQWGLVPTGVQAIRQELLQRGARAVKLTGAGGGGFLVALW